MNRFTSFNLIAICSSTSVHWWITNINNKSIVRKHVVYGLLSDFDESWRIYRAIECWTLPWLQNPNTEVNVVRIGFQVVEQYKKTGKVVALIWDYLKGFGRISNPDFLILFDSIFSFCQFLQHIEILVCSVYDGEIDRMKMLSKREWRMGRWDDFLCAREMHWFPFLQI